MLATAQSSLLDASVARSWFFEDEYTEYAHLVADLLNVDGASVLTIWPDEVANGLLSSARRGRLLELYVHPQLDRLLRLRVEIEPVTAGENHVPASLGLGLAYRLSAYDASYLQLAVRRGPPLATQDKRLADATIAAGVVILQP